MSGSWRRSAFVAVVGTIAALLTMVQGSPASAGIKPGLYTPSPYATCHYTAAGRLGSVTVAPAKVAMQKKLARQGKRYQYVGWSARLQGLKAGAWHDVAAHPGRGGYTISVRAKALHKVALPGKADAGVATFTSYELGSGYSSYRTVVTLKWFAPNGKKTRGSVTSVVPLYRAAGGSSSYRLPGASATGCATTLAPTGRISVANTTDPGQTTPGALVDGTVTSTWPISRKVTAYLLGPVTTSSGVCPSGQSLASATWSGTVTVPAHGSYKFSEQAVSSSGYYWWYVTGAGSSSCSTGAQVLPTQATSSTPEVTLTNASTIPVGSPATATVTTNQSESVTLAILGPATSSGGACASPASYTYPAATASNSQPYYSPEHAMTASGWYAVQATAANGLKSYCSDATTFQVTKATPRVTWTSTPTKTTMPTLVSGRYTTSGGYGAYAGKLTLYKAFTKASASCTPVSGVVGTVGSFAVTGNGSNAVLQANTAIATSLKNYGPGWYRWGFTSASNTANNAVTTPQCSPTIDGEFAGVKMSVTTPDGPYTTGTTRYATVRFNTSSIASTNSKKLENGNYSVVMRMYTGSSWDAIKCTGAAKYTRSVKLSTLANSIQIPMSVSAANAGLYKFTLTWSAAGGAQADVGGVGCGNNRQWKK